MITVYVKPACVQCDATKRFLDKHNAEYQTIDITENAEVLEKLLLWGHAAAPVVVTEHSMWSGFQPDKLSTIV